MKIGYLATILKQYNILLLLLLLGKGYIHDCRAHNSYLPIQDSTHSFYT